MRRKFYFFSILHKLWYSIVYAVIILNKACTEKRRIAIYARKSKVTETGKSIENQIKKCKSYAVLKFDAEEEDIAIYSDEGLSGFYSDRPNYKRMLYDIKQNQIKAVICYKFDRISRKTIDLLNLVEQLRRMKISFISCTDDIDTGSKTGRILMSLLASIAEFERDIIAERIADNMYELAKEGRWLGGVTPTGFVSKKRYGSIGNKKVAIPYLECIPKEIDCVQKIYQYFLDTASVKKTVDQLRAEGLYTKNNHVFTSQSVKDILRNPVYASADQQMYQYLQSLEIPVYGEKTEFNGKHGLMVYNKTEQSKNMKIESSIVTPVYVKRSASKNFKEWIAAPGEHPPVIPSYTWIYIQTLLDSHKNKFNRPNEKSLSLLSGLIYCPICGDRMYTRKLGERVSNNQPRFNYVCRKKFHNRTSCPSKNVNGNWADSYVFEAVCKLDWVIDLEKCIACSAFPTPWTFKQKEKRMAEQKREIQQKIEIQIRNLRQAPEGIAEMIFRDIQILQQALQLLEYAAQKAEQGKPSSDKKENVCRKNQDIKINTTTCKTIDGLETKNIKEKDQKEESAFLSMGRIEKIEMLHILISHIVYDQEEEAIHIFLKGAVPDLFL